MKAVLQRTILNDKRSLGIFRVYKEGKEIWSCWACEDMVRGDGDPKTVKEWKIHGKSAIPYGTYAVSLTHSEKYGKPMWEVLNVPGYKGIRIHSGNTEEDTEGCLLLGMRPLPQNAGIQESKKAMDEFTQLFKKEGNRDFTLDIIRPTDTVDLTEPIIHAEEPTEVNTEEEEKPKKKRGKK